MNLTKSAIGNLINRYKAVLKKCNLINIFGSLAVASMLIMGGIAGGVNVANAEELNTGGVDFSGKSGAITITSRGREKAVSVTGSNVSGDLTTLKIEVVEVSPTPDTFFSVPASLWITTINELTFSEAVTVQGNGFAAPGSLIVYGGVFTSQTMTTLNAYGVLDVKAGGEHIGDVTVNGADARMYFELGTVTGDVTVLNGELDVKTSGTIKDGKLTLGGSATQPMWARVHFSSTGLSLDADTTIKKYGSVDFSQADSKLVGNFILEEGGTISVLARGIFDSNAGTFVSGDTSGTIITSITGDATNNIVINGGTINVEGSHKKEFGQSTDSSDATLILYALNNPINMAGGTINVKGGTGAIEGAGATAGNTTATLNMTAKSLEMKGGKINIAPLGDEAGTAQILASGVNFNLSGTSEIKVGDGTSGQLNIGGIAPTTDSGMHVSNMSIKDEAKVSTKVATVAGTPTGTGGFTPSTLETSALNLYAEANASPDKAGLNAQQLIIGRFATAKVNSDLTATLSAGEVGVDNEIAFHNGSTLAVNGTLTIATAAINIRDVSSTVAVKDIKSTDNGKTLAITKGQLAFSGFADKTTVTGSQYDKITVAKTDGALSLGGLTLPSGFGVDRNSGATYGGSIESAGFVAVDANWTVEGNVSLTDATAVLQLGHSDLTVNGNLNVSAGNVYFINDATLIVKGNVDTAGTGNIGLQNDSILTINGKMKLESVAAIKVGDGNYTNSVLHLGENSTFDATTVAKSIKVGKTGVVNAHWDTLLNAAGTDTNPTGVKVFDMLAGSILNVSDWGASAEAITFAEAATMGAKVADANAGQVNFLNAVFAGDMTTGNAGSGIFAPDVTLKDDTGETTIEAAVLKTTVEKIEITNVVGDEVDLVNVVDLGLVGGAVGDPSEQLVDAKKADGTPVKTNIEVVDTGVVTLGNVNAAADVKTQGVLGGDIKFAESGTMKVANGNFEVTGDIDATTATGDQGINVNNSNLTVLGDIGATKAIASLNVEDKSSMTAAKNVTAEKVIIKSGGELKVEGILKITAGQSVTVGSNVAAGEAKLSVNSLDATAAGITLYADPAWQDTALNADNPLTNSARIAVKDFGAGSKAITAHLVSGQAGQIAVGTADTNWLASTMEDDKGNNYAGNWGHGGITAAFGITGGPFTIAAGGGVTVDGLHNLATPPAFGAANTAASGGAHFGAGSLFVVDVTGLASGTALTANAGANIEVKAGAKLLLSGVTDEKSVKIAAATGAGKVNFETKDKAWGQGQVETTAAADKTLFFDNPLLFGTGVLDAAGQTYSIDSIGRSTATEALPGIDSGLGGLIEAASDAGIVSKTSPYAGGRVIARVGDLPVEERAVVIESISKIGVSSGVVSSTGDVGGASSVNANVRTSLASADMDKAVAINFDGENVKVSGLSGEGGMQNGLGLWLMPMYQNHSANGFKSGSFEYGYNTDIFGISLGSDYTLDSQFRIGAALHLGTGNSSSTGDFSGTDNKFNYYGFSLYSGYHFNNFGISADIGYTVTDSDVDQDTAVGDFSSDIDAQLFTAGLRAEYIFNAGSVDIIPHVGVRVNSLHVNGYDVNAKDALGGVAFAVDDVNSTTVQFPIGVALSTTITTADGWEFSPSADVGVMFTTGGTSIEQEVRMPGVAGSANMSSNVYDVTTFQGGLGINMAKDNFSLGLNYQLNASEHVTSHGVFATLRYEF